MSIEFIIGMLAIGAFSGLLMAVLQWMAMSERFKQYRIRTPDKQSIPLSRKVENIGLNMLFSLLIFVAALYLFSGYLLDATAVSWVTIFGQTLAVLLLYDFMYYIMHRTLHHPKLMKYIHGVHHRARFPTATESLFLHPVEAFAGIALLLISTAMIGPVSPVAFLCIFFLHTVINILVHANLVLPHPIFKLTNYWAMKHDYHHGKHLNRNYASIFPFWDMMFDTYK